MSTGTKSRGLLFVCGAARSGTSALVRLLNAHRYMMVTAERYADLLLKEPSLREEHFEEERFFTFHEGDSFYNAVDQWVEKSLRRRYPEARYIGDKIPRLYEKIDYIASTFTTATVIVISRNIFDVAASFNSRARDTNDLLWSRHDDFRAAVQQWNQAHNAIIQSAAKCKNLEFIGVDYESLFFDKKHIATLFNALNLPDDSSLIDEDTISTLIAEAAELETKRGDTLSSGEKRFLCNHADVNAYRHLRDLVPWIK